MPRRASDTYAVWRAFVLSTPWVSEVNGDVQCRALSGYVLKKHRGNPEMTDHYRCHKRAKFKFKAVVTRSMLTVDAVSGNYCPRHLQQIIKDYPAEAERFERRREMYERRKGSTGSS